LSRLAEKIRKTMVGTIAEYDLLEAGDRVLAAVSGGKDSTIMLLMLEEIRRRAPFDFEVEAVMLDQKQPGFDVREYRDYLDSLGFALRVIEQDTYSVVVRSTKPGKSYCGLCSRLRRGALYSFAHANGFSKIALGHHREDLNETLLLNLFFAGAIASMPPRLESNDGRNTVIRPLAEVAESELIAYASELRIPVIPCNLCGSQETRRRAEMKALLAELESRYPGLRGSMLTAQRNVRPSQLMSRELSSFASEIGKLAPEAARHEADPATAAPKSIGPEAGPAPLEPESVEREAGLPRHETSTTERLAGDQSA
jgi:tRNA 2-thiocytidine biosynthesis protein TtcA